MHKAKTNNFRKIISVLLVVMMLVSVMPIAVSAETAEATFENTSGDGKDVISLAEGRSYLATIPVSGSVDPDSITWSMDRDDSKEYVSKSLFPNQTEGGALDTWLCSDDETQLFKDVTTTFENGKLVVKFSTNAYFYGYDWWSGTTYPDDSAPHDEGGSYLDVCGYFNLTAKDASGNDVGTAPVKIVPYDSFRTMTEIYTELDEMVALAADSGYYVKKCSMGSSSGILYDALDMPYLIIAKDEATVTDWLKFTDQAETNPTQVLADIKAGEYNDIKVPVMYSNIHSNEVAATDGIMEYAWMLINAMTGDGKLSYNNLTGFTDEGKTELETEMTEGNVAVPDLVKDTATYLGYLTEDNSGSGVVDMDRYYEQETVNTTVGELLDDVFLILVPEENVEGRTYITREASNGYDLNRDNSFQTTEETQNMQKLIATFNPVSLTEFHGRISAFQCEPCDPPHEPNFEYDLLADHLISGGEALGIAAVANNDTYNSYVIPQRDYLSTTEDGGTYWSDPWDDMSTSYTPQFAMLQGTVAYTVELPGYNDAGAQLVQYGCLGQSNYIASEKIGYLTSQTEIFERGVTNANSDADELVGQWLTDQYDVEGAESDIFRPEYDGEGENGNFYPECYIIPLDAENQSNLQAAGDMMEWLSRNDVKILLTSSEFTYDGVTYPAGTMIVSMYQAKRSVANGALYDGTLITNWTVLYSEGITSFNETRGFDMITVAEPEAYKTIKTACGSWMDYEDCMSYKNSSLGSEIIGSDFEYVIISNASEDSTAAVNALLQDGKTVGMVTDSESEYYGDFVCSYNDWLAVSDEYVITGTALDGSDVPAAKVITKAPTVYFPGAVGPDSTGFKWTSRVCGNNAQWNYDREALELMGFKTTDDPSEATLIMGGDTLDDTAEAAVLSGTPYIAYGEYATSNTIFGSSLTRNYADGMDCLGYVTYPTTTLVNASYVMDGDNVMYGYGVGYFSAIPEGAQVLVQMDGSKTPTEGFIIQISDEQKESAAAYLNNSVQAFSYTGKVEGSGDNDVNVVMFANSLTHKVHQRDEYAFISNFAFSSLLGEDFTVDNSNLPFTDVESGKWYTDSIESVYNKGYMVGISDTLFGINNTLTRDQFVTILYRMLGSPSVEGMTAPFTDIENCTWSLNAIIWAYNTGISNGCDNNQFCPAQEISREQMVTMLYRYAKTPQADGELGFTDAAEISNFAKDAVLWAVQNDIVHGNGNGEFKPKDTAIRAQAAVVIANYSKIA